MHIITILIIVAPLVCAGLIALGASTAIAGKLTALISVALAAALVIASAGALVQTVLAAVVFHAFRRQLARHYA